MKNKILRSYNLLLPPPNIKKGLVFIHIPKSAGSSLTQSISDLFRSPIKPWKNDIFHVNPKATAELAKFSNSNLLSEREKICMYAISSNFKFIAGHFGYSPSLKLLAEDKYIFFTIFRHPVDRFLSEYFYNFHKKSNHFKITLDLDQYLDSEVAVDSARTYLRYMGVSSNGNYDESKLGLNHAKANLKDIDIIAILEDFDFSIAILKKFLGRNFYIPHLNSNPAKKYIDRINKQQLMKIAKMCETDLEIYEYAKQIQKDRLR